MNTQTQTIPVDLIDSSPLNPRKTFDGEALDELAASIEVHGILQALTVRPNGPRYELVCGERRWRAAKIAGLQTVPALVRDLDDETVMEQMLIENSQREDVSPLEEADSIHKLASAFLRSVESIADKLGKSTSLVRRRLKLAQLIPHFRQLLDDERIGLGSAEAIATLPENLQDELTDQFDPEKTDYSGNLYTWQPYNVKGAIRGVLRALDNAPWGADEELAGCARTCHACPKRSGAQPTLLAHLDDENDRCLDEACWNQKMEAWTARKVAEGWEMLEGEEAEKAADPWGRTKSIQPITSTVWAHGERKSYEELAPNAPRLLAITARGAVPCVRVADVLEAVKARGDDELYAQLTGEKKNAERAERKKEKAAEDQARRAKMAGVVTAAASSGDFLEDWIDIILEAAIYEVNQHPLIELCRRRDIDGPKGEYGRNYSADVWEYAQQLDAADKQGLLVEVLMTASSLSFRSDDMPHWVAALECGNIDTSADAAAE